MKSDRELRIFIREVIAEKRLWESVDSSEVKIGTKLSDKEGGTPVAVIVGFMENEPVDQVMAGYSKKTPIAKVYSQASGNKQFEIPDLGKGTFAIKGSKVTSYNYDPIARGVGTYLTAQEAKDSVFEYDTNTDEGNWLATYLAAAGNLGASAAIDTQNLTYAMNVREIALEQDTEGSLSDGTFYNVSHLFVPYLDKLYTPSFRYTSQAKVEKATGCLLTQQEFLKMLPDYVAHLSHGATGGRSYSNLSAVNITRMTMCIQEKTQGFLYKTATLVIALLLQRFGIPSGVAYGVAQILPAIGPMAYHAKEGNVYAFSVYILQITADIIGFMTTPLSASGAAALVVDIICSAALGIVSDPSFSGRVKSFLEQKNIETVEDVIRVSRELSSYDNLDPQDLTSLVPSI